MVLRPVFPFLLFLPAGASFAFSVVPRFSAGHARKPRSTRTSRRALVSLVTNDFIYTVRLFETDVPRISSSADFDRFLSAAIKQSAINRAPCAIVNIYFPRDALPPRVLTFLARRFDVSVDRINFERIPSNPVFNEEDRQTKYAHGV